MKVHFSIRSGRAICGANEGQKMRAKVAVTGDTERVTCAKCVKHMAGYKSFAEELASKVLPGVR
jgi:predicted TIM-barrel enzyme